MVPVGWVLGRHLAGQQGNLRLRYFGEIGDLHRPCAQYSTTKAGILHFTTKPRWYSKTRRTEEFQEQSVRVPTFSSAPALTRPTRPIVMGSTSRSRAAFPWEGSQSRGGRGKGANAPIQSVNGSMSLMKPIARGIATQTPVPIFAIRCTDGVM